MKLTIPIVCLVNFIKMKTYALFAAASFAQVSKWLRFSWRTFDWILLWLSNEIISDSSFFLSLCVCLTESEQNSVLKMVHGIFGPMILLLSLSLIHESKSIYFAFLRPKFISFSLFKKKKGMNDKMVHGLESNYTENSNLYFSLWREHSLFRRVFAFCFHRLALVCLSRNHLQKPIRNGWRWFPFIACSAANSLGNWSLWNIARDNTIRLGITFANTNKVAKITCTFFVWFNLLFIQSNKWQRRDKKLIAIRFEMVHFWMIFFIFTFN